MKEVRELGRKIPGGREFQTKQKTNVTVESCLLYPRSNRKASFHINSGRERGSVAHGKIGMKKILLGINQGRRKF